MNVKRGLIALALSLWISAPLHAQDTKKNYFFFGLKFSPVIPISKEYNQTHDMDIGAGIEGGYQHEWLSVYGEFAPTFGFGGKVDMGGGRKEGYSTRGIWFNLNFASKVLGNTDNLALLLGAGAGFVHFSSDLSTYESELSWSANLRAGAFKRMKVGRLGVDLETRFSGIEFPPGGRKLILAIMNFYWDFVF